MSDWLNSTNQALPGATNTFTGFCLPQYDKIDMTYNLDSTLDTVTYYKGGVMVGQLKLSYAAGLTIRVEQVF